MVKLGNTGWKKKKKHQKLMLDSNKNAEIKGKGHHD